MAEHSHAERTPPRVELSTNELALLLGADRFNESEEIHARLSEPIPPQEHLSPAPAQPAHAVQEPHGAPRFLGDTDLVQAIVEGAPNFQELLLRIVRERTNEPLVRIVDGTAADAMVSAGTATPLDGSRALVAPLAPDVRNAWAAWMTRWSALASLVALRAPKGAWDDPTGLPVWHRVKTHTAQRIAAAREVRQAVHVSVLRVIDTDLWNRRAQVLIGDPFLARAAAHLDECVAPGDELSRLDDATFVLVSGRDEGSSVLADALRRVIQQLPGDGPRSLTVRVGSASAPWDAVCPQVLLETALRRAAE